MRDEKDGRKKQARSNKQTRQSNIAHPRQSLFLRKMSCLCIGTLQHNIVGNCSNDHLGNCGASVPTHGLYALGIVERLRLVWCLIHETTVTLLSLENAGIVNLGEEGGGREGGKEV